MQPLSKRKRRLYLYGLILVFALCVPFVMFYANGYRFKGEQGFVKTGSVIISVPETNAVVSLNGEEVGASGFLRHSFYIDDLTPGAYAVLVTREGDYPWHRTLIVEQELVTDAEAFLVPQEIEPIRLVVSTSTASSTMRVSPATYEMYRLAFAPTATSTVLNSAMRQGEIVVVEKGNVLVRHTDPSALPPSRYCTRPSVCVQEIPIESGKQQAINAAFFGGGVVYATREGGVFLAEADIRPAPVVAPLYSGRNVDFRIVNGHLIIKDGVALYEIVEL
ncbi:hypothetical protein A2763_00675 [Candidatus Kaiserbacteria bacterium RIFCSPHIGHO2_01_FULL_54_36]|uniref:PEGA domain-containing protein n=1 Tax=Candidatus Kaiserbacteria bacterium RIFCSPHIGHO2_01_FULL_54_36 TaxID=1798482 RepID=A0A1F6CP14_9BACT|nr:MAG: hypothetical protein A2763_00675 [Candidatus Kaiserbacteria bacterium RIFCSPHIGHO2_01_FULL_54_36]OGG75544.1 MAG: hypothetical protein A3A41_02880 [Candidatus Kaiserbacteria bacterium RIFCSPLOWO2_01_FULL_54_22]